ncbi:MAG: winged helix-turn-helix domain-containing protein, partial [Acidimicrobiia bacterium]|nr:winged helix-turn-helix domain-containing protein [Acidimicrobiia bacterium]
MSEELRVLVLGPVEVERAGELLSIGGRRARSILAALVISLRHAVSDDRLIEAVWGDEPPESARASVQSHISRLRGVLGHDVVQRHDHSYVLEIDPGQVDACVFERTFGQAAEIFPSDPAETLQLCRRALEVWRGPPFGDLGEADFALPEAVRLEELRVDATELFLEATIAVEGPGMAV